MERPLLETVCVVCKGERGRHRPSPPKRKSRHPAVALKKKKAMSGDRSPWWRSSSQSSASFEVKGETKPNKWGDVACHFCHLGSLVSDKKRETWHKSMEETKKEVGETKCH